MYILGVNLAEKKLIKIALTSFVGIGHHTAGLICARLSFHDRLTVADLSETQITRLSALLSTPSTTPPVATPIAPFLGITPPSGRNLDTPNKELKTLKVEDDPLQKMVLENELRKEVMANIAHHRNVGSYKGRRHALGFPVRGQNTHSNAKTAKRLNRIDRRAFSTATSGISFSHLPRSRQTTSALVRAIDRSHGFSSMRNA